MILSALARTKRNKYKNKQTHSNTSTNYQMFFKKNKVWKNVHKYKEAASKSMHQQLLVHWNVIVMYRIFHALTASNHQLQNKPIKYNAKLTYTAVFTMRMLHTA